jgi:hypothetical protein
VGPAHPRKHLGHPTIKLKNNKKKIKMQNISIICLWFKIWPTPAKNHCYALADNYDHKILFKLKNSESFYERVIYVAGIKALNQTLFVNHLVFFSPIYSSTSLWFIRTPCSLISKNFRQFRKYQGHYHIQTAENKQFY